MNNDLFKEISLEEMMIINGGGPSPKDKEAAHVNMANMKGGEKVATAYTLGYLSLATCWCAPLSFAFGLAGVIYTCATA